MARGRPSGGAAEAARHEDGRAAEARGGRAAESVRREGGGARGAVVRLVGRNEERGGSVGGARKKRRERVIGRLTVGRLQATESRRHPQLPPACWVPPGGEKVLLGGWL